MIREIAANRDRHKMLVTTGGGTRSRHIYAIGLELGMPSGVIAKFGGSVSEQNALLVALLLAYQGGVKIGHDDVVKLPQYFSQGCMPVMHAMPPYDYFALPSPRGRIPIHRTDVGTILIADLIGAKNCLFVKDEKGLYTDDTKKNPQATFIPEIDPQALLDRDLDDLVVERPCLEILLQSEVLRSIQIVNGLEEGNLTAALAGEPVGTIIRKNCRSRSLSPRASAPPRHPKISPHTRANCDLCITLHIDISYKQLFKFLRGAPDRKWHIGQGFLGWRICVWTPRWGGTGVAVRLERHRVSTASAGIGCRTKGAGRDPNPGRDDL